MSSDYGDEYTRPAPSLSRQTTLSSIEELDVDRIPEGTVASRLHRLQQLARQDPDSVLPPYSQRDRDGESSGWGRRIEGEIRLVQPASHYTSIDVKHDSPRRVASSYLRRPSDLSAIPEAIVIASMNHRSSASILQPRRKLEPDSPPDSPPSTVSSRREDARQMFEEHRVSLPPG